MGYLYTQCNLVVQLIGKQNTYEICSPLHFCMSGDVRGVEKSLHSHVYLVYQCKFIALKDTYT